VSEPKRCLMIGAGGMAGSWIRAFLPPFRERLEVVALVDVDAAALSQGGDLLGLPAPRRYATMAAAFDEVEADCCVVVVPPAFHREAVLRAAARGMAILSEKPIADTWEAALDVYRTVTRAGVKMAVTQNYRYIVPQLTLRGVLRSGELGRVNYVVGRFAADYRRYASWGRSSATRSPTGCSSRARCTTSTCCATWPGRTAPASPAGSGTRPGAQPKAPSTPTT
jgi:predicted dehydrogenase